MKGEGYFMLDHRASPGIPEELAVKLGYDPAFVGEGKMLEGATLCCCHCKGHVIKRPERTRERASCPKCSHKFLCDGCAAAARHPDYDHLPFEKQIDVVLEHGHRGQTLGTPLELMLAAKKV